MRRAVDALRWPVGLAVPLVLLAVVLAHPVVDRSWENDPAHFWLVLGAALASVGLGGTIGVAARRRRDARLLLVSLAFVTASSFLGLHALATPGVLVGQNAGFELATPVGLVLAGLVAAASGLELDARAARRVRNAWPALLGALGLLVGVWALVSLLELWPLNRPLRTGEQIDGWQVPLAAVGTVFYGAAAYGYIRLYRRRRAPVLLATTLAFAMLAEAMLVIVWARNWHVSWWEWHVLMVGAFAAISLGVRAEWYQERFSALYLEQTLSSPREVSVLFADLAGFTSFSERHGLADVGKMLAVYFEDLVPLLEDEGGQVHELIGDEIMVVFNMDGDAPDHAALAARAALAFQDAAAGISAAHPGWPRFRVGINSGMVLAGIVGASRGHRKHDILGDTVNLAARLQTQAPVGGVVVGAETARRLDGAELERLPPLAIKGKEAPVEAFVLRRV
jgi:class 3 adenylate cyclase